MGLSMNDRRILAEIDRRLTAADPRLAARLSTLAGSHLNVAALKGAVWRHLDALGFWVTTALAVALFVVAGTTHAPALTGLGVAVLLAAGITACVRWLRHHPPQDHTARHHPPQGLGR